MRTCARSSLTIGSLLLAASLGPTVAPAQLKRPDAAPRPQASAAISSFAGVFDLASSKGPNACQATLTDEAQGNGFRLGLPYGCRKAFPALVRAEQWSPGPGGGIRFQSIDGATLLDFTRKDRRLTTDAREAVVYELKPADPTWFDRTGGSAASSAPAVAPPGRAPAQPSAPLDPATLTGRWTVLRPTGKAGACELDLGRVPFASKTKTLPGARQAGLVEGCEDKGLRIFDPVGWRTEPGRLILIARKGHELTLVEGGAGWRKEKASGEALELKRR